MTNKPRKRTGPPAPSGYNKETGEWTPQFPGQRPPPWTKGHELSLRHGAYRAPDRLGERPRELADCIRSYVPGFSDGMEPMLVSYSIVLTRIERAAIALEEVEAGTEIGKSYQRGPDDLLLNLRGDLRAWIRLGAQLASELGLSPASAARILKDVGVGAHAAAQHQALLERYRGAA